MHFCRPLQPFYEPYLTKKKLLALAEELQLAPVPPTLLEKNFRAETDALRNLEQEYFLAFSARHRLPKAFMWFACPSLQEEIRFAAGKILRLVREEGLRFRQIAIVNKRHGGVLKRVCAAF